MEQITFNNLRYYRFSSLPHVKHGIFTRHGGISPAPFASLNLGGTVGDEVEHVHANHDLMYEALKVDRNHTVTVWMVHGTDVVIADRPVQGRRWLTHADAMITDKPGVSLVMRYADCTPIFAHDPVKGAIGIAHAGWQGTVKGVAANLIRAMMQAYDSYPADIIAGIGPSIGPERYQVGEEVVAAVQAHFSTTEGLIRRHPDDGTAYFDLWEANRRELMREGVEQVEIMGLCTATHTEDWFSHRAEKGKTGRFGAVLTLDS